MSRHTLRGLIVLLIVLALVVTIKWCTTERRQEPDSEWQVAVEAYDPVVTDSASARQDSARQDSVGCKPAKSKKTRGGKKKQNRVVSRDKQFNETKRE